MSPTSTPKDTHVAQKRPTNTAGHQSGRHAPAECTLVAGGQVLVVVRARAAEVERLSRSLRKHRYVQEMARLGLRVEG